MNENAPNGRVDWLPDVLRSVGLDVYVMPGAMTRGRSTMRYVSGVVAHHTATGPRWQDGHVAFLLRDGRPDLAGPLSQLGLERDGTFVVIATGTANHNGYGEWKNDSIGIEAYNSGLGEPWPTVQVLAYQLGAAAILDHLGHGADRFKGHRETDPRRKIDPAGLNMDNMRRAVTTFMAGGPPAATTPPPPEEDTMSFVHVKDLKRWYAILPDGVVRLNDAHAWELAAGGAKFIYMNDATFRHLHSGPRRVNFSDSPTLGD